MSRQLKFLGFAVDGTLIASLYNVKNNVDTEPFEETLDKIFSSAGWTAVTQEGRQKLELKHGANTFCIELDASKRIFIAVVSSSYPTNYIFSSSRQASSATYRLMTEFKNRVMNALAVDSTLANITSLHGSTSQTARLRRAVRSVFKPLFEKWGNAKNIDMLLEREKAEKLAEAGRSLHGQQNINMNVPNSSVSSEFDGLLTPTYESSRKRPFLGMRFFLRKRRNSGIFTSYDVATRSCLCFEFKTRKHMYITITFMTAALLFILLLVLNFAVFRWF